jgi:hypothetical protein
MKRNQSFSTTRLLLFAVLIVLAVAPAFVLTIPEWRAFSAMEGLPSAQATPTPFACQPQPASCPSPPVVTVNSPQVPCDVCIPSGFGSNPIAFFDDYSWRSFIALVWPAQIQNNQRGVPDTTQSVGGTGPRVFETYKGLWEVFPFDSATQNFVTPVGWNQNSAPTVNACGQSVGAGDLVLASFSKYSDLGQAGFGNLVGPLLAGNTTYVHYLTAYNQIEFDQIFNNKWYLRANLPPTIPSITFDNNSLDVKSAWMAMNGVTNPKRYYTRMAWVMDQNGNCSNMLVGLVGLHIVQKTPTRPQWIWSTFEQVDNVPPAAPGAPGAFGPGTYNFNDGTSRPMPSPPNPIPLPPPAVTPTPFNVTRTFPINPSTANTNKAYQAALSGTPWQFYQLVMTQWPVPGNTPSNSGFPSFTFPGNSPISAFSNVTLETFDQASISTGCMACHTITQKNTDFLWSLADHAIPPKIPALMMQDESIRRLKALIESRSAVTKAGPPTTIKKKGKPATKKQ